MSFDDDLQLFPTEIEIVKSTCVCGNFLLDDDDVVLCSSEVCSQRWYHRDCSGVDALVLSDAGASTSAAGSNSDSVSYTYDTSAWICDLCLLDTEVLQLSTSGSDISSEPKTEEAGTSAVAVDRLKSGQSSTSKSKSRVTPKGPKTTHQNKKRKSQLKRDQVLCKSVTIISDVLKKAPEGEEFQSEFGHCKEVLATAAGLLLHCSTECFATASNQILEELWTVLTAGDHLSVGGSAASVMWQKFHDLRIDGEMRQLWDNLFQKCGVAATPVVRRLLQQYTMESALLTLIVMRNKADIVPTTSATERHLDEHNEHVLRYVAGFVPFSLIKRYRKHSDATEYVRFLESLKAQEDGKTEATSFLTYTTSWVNIQNRGGLFKVNDQMYRIFRRMELSTQEVLLQKKLGTLKDVNVKAILKERIMNDMILQKLWTEIVSRETERVNWQTLLETITNYWVKIRIFAFVKVLMDIRKRSQVQAAVKRKRDSVAKKGEKSLRKELKK